MKPIGITALVSVIGLVACSDMPPTIAKDLHGDAYAISAALDQRAKARFPVGSDEAVLRAELARERFVVRAKPDPGTGFSATYEHSDFTCRVDWTILWRAEEGKIVDIGAKYWPTCL
jgi:hypothetical protein